MNWNNFFLLIIFGIAGVAERRIAGSIFMNWNIFFCLKFLESQESQSRRIAESIYMNWNNFFLLKIFGIAGVAESQDRRIASGPTLSDLIQKYHPSLKAKLLSPVWDGIPDLVPTGQSEPIQSKTILRWDTMYTNKRKKNCYAENGNAKLSFF